MVDRRTTAIKFPSLTQVSQAILSMKPGAGGLECDICSMKDVVSSKWGSLDPGLAEAFMILKMTKDKIAINTKAVQKLHSNWRSYIPKHKMFLTEYHVAVEEDMNVVVDIDIDCSNTDIEGNDTYLGDSA